MKDTGCSPEDLPEAMNDREKWREMVRDIRAGGTITTFLQKYGEKFPFSRVNNQPSDVVNNSKALYTQTYVQGEG